MVGETRCQREGWVAQCNLNGTAQEVSESLAQFAAFTEDKGRFGQSNEDSDADGHTENDRWSWVQWLAQETVEIGRKNTEFPGGAQDKSRC